MNRIVITAGVVAVAVLAVAFAVNNNRSGNAQLTMEADITIEAPVAAVNPAPAAAEVASDSLEAVATEAPTEYKKPSKTRGLLVTQDQTGTECKTPSGRVCTVSPGRINSPCACGSQNGLIIR